jgi:DNA-binding NarL/FixJ family response regulator
MEPARRPKEMATDSELVHKLHGQIKTLRAQLAQAKATIARFSQGTRSRMLQSPTAERMLRKFDLLSPRERDIARLFIEFPCDKKVARRLGTQPQTVRNQISSIEKKLGVDSREELVIFMLAVLHAQDEA